MEMSAVNQDKEFHLYRDIQERTDGEIGRAGADGKIYFYQAFYGHYGASLYGGRKCEGQDCG